MRHDEPPNRKLRGEDGFTLIELLTVVIIIGILASIAIAQFINQRDSAYQAAAASSVRNAVPEVEAYFAKEQAYPADQAEFETIGLAPISNVVLSYTLVSDTSYRIEADHELRDADGLAGPLGDVDAFYASAVGRVQTP